jgi:sugar phosphate isomerase/epimerase
MTQPRNPLSLHHLTLMDVSVPELIDIAAKLDVPHVGVFVRGSGRNGSAFPLVADEAGLRAAKERLNATGVTVHNLEVFIITPKTDPAAFRPALEMGAALGAARLTGQVSDPDESRAHDNFAGLCEEAAKVGLAVHIEFTVFAEVKSLAATRRFLAKQRPANASIAVDALHLYRNDGSADGLALNDGIPIGYGQICDGALARHPGGDIFEALEERTMPGKGQFDLPAVVRGIPPDIVIDVEVPSKSLRESGLSPLERARAMVDAARRFVPA